MEEIKLPLVNRFDLNRSSLIEASAGTGKTFTISNLVLRLLMGDPKGNNKNAVNYGKPLDIENILIVTFTNAAASDLRARVLESVHNTRVLFEKLKDTPSSQRESLLDEVLGGKENRKGDPLNYIIAQYIGDLCSDDAKGRLLSYIRLLKRAESSIDNAPISTIHSFCNRALNRIYAFEAGRPFNIELSQDISAQLTEALNSVWRELFYIKGDLKAEELLNAAALNSPLDIMENINSLRSVRCLDQNDGYYGFALRVPQKLLKEERSDPALRLRHLVEKAVFLYADYQKKLAVPFETVKGFKDRLYASDGGFALYQSADLKEFYALVKDANELVASIASMPDSMDALCLAELVFSYAKLDFDKKARSVFVSRESPKKKYRYEDDIRCFEGALGDLRASYSEYCEIRSALSLEIVNLLAIRVIQKTDEICSRDGVISNDELLRNLAVALNDKSSKRGQRLCALLRQNYPVAMIDEFQDTDPVQYAIFRELYLNEDAAASHAVCYLIGDPKQSIYAFRGSDINSYNMAKESVIKLNGGKSLGCIYSLDTNYRSAKNVIEGVNLIFGENPLADDDYPYLRQPFDYSEEFSSLMPSRISFTSVKDSGREPKCGLFHFKDEDPHKKSGCYVRNIELLDPKANKESFLYIHAKAAAMDIYQALSQGFFEKDSVLRGVRPSDIAVLVSNRAESDAIREALASLKIQSVYLSDRSSVLRSSENPGAMNNAVSEEALNILYLMEAIEEPTSLPKVKRILGSTLIALTGDEFISLSEGSKTDDEMRLLKECRLKWDRHGFLPAFYHYMRAHNVYRRMLLNSQGLRSLTNYCHIAQIVQSVNSQNPGISAQLLWYVNELTDGAKCTLGEDETLKRLESERQVVRIYTIHKSKGLQYPLVFVPFLYRSVYERASGATVFYDPAEKRNVLDMTADAVVFSGKEISIDYLNKIASHQEWVRLLYVALTRAQAGNFLYVSNHAIAAANYTDSAFKAVILGKDGKLKALSDESVFTFLPDKTQDQIEQFNAQYECQSDETKVPVTLNTLTKSPDSSFTVSSYSAIVRGAASHSVQCLEADEDHSADALQSTMEQKSFKFNFAKGKYAGVFLHCIMEQVLYQRKENRKNADDILNIIRLRCPVHKEERVLKDTSDEYLQELSEWIFEVLSTPLGIGDYEGVPLCLNSLSEHQCLKELEYFLPTSSFDCDEFNQLCSEFSKTLVLDEGIEVKDISHADFKGYVKGSLDLVAAFTDDEGICRYYMIDYKSNYLGDSEECYTQENLSRSMLLSRYDVQILLYTLALHRFLEQSVKNYDYNRDFGGVIYLYLRGMGASGAKSYGVRKLKPDFEIIKRLSALFKGDIL